jgi:hypothetical protein
MRWLLAAGLCAAGCSGGKLERDTLAHVVSVSAMGTVSPDERGSLETLGKGVGINYLVIHYLTARLVDKPLAPYASLGIGVMGELGGTAVDLDGDGDPDPERNGGLSWHAAGGVHGFVNRVYWGADLGYQGGPVSGMRGRASLGYIVGATDF